MKKQITLEYIEKLLSESGSEITDEIIFGDIVFDKNDISSDKYPKAVEFLGKETYEAARKFAEIAISLGYVPDSDLIDFIYPDKRKKTCGVLKVNELIPQVYKRQEIKYQNKIQEVVLGATKADGGTRKNKIVLGGEKNVSYFPGDVSFNGNYVSLDVFDMPISLARAVRERYEDVLEDPAEWAKKAVKEYNADMVTLHLISTDPSIKDTSAREASKTVENVLQAVDVPIIIGGSGNPEKDPEVLEKAAEAAEGERVLLASANLNMDFQRIGKAAVKYGHAVLSWTQMDINSQKELNRKLIRLCNLNPDSLVMDPTTAALGYGLDYAYSNMERIRLSGLSGDLELAFPLSSGTTNAWGAREAWMKESPNPQDSDWGMREYRGPLWEAVTGLTLAQAGNDLFMMMHPTAVALLKSITKALGGK